MLALLAVALVASVGVAGDEKAADPAAAQQAMMAAMTPGEHHEHIKMLAGNYDYTMKMWMDAASPPMESTGKRTGDLMFGGRYLKETFTGTFMGMPFEGVGMLGYDNVQKKYVTTWIDNMGTGILSGSGQCKDGTWEMTSEMVDPATGKMLKTRSVVRLPDANTMTMEMYMPGADGKEFKMMEISMKRAS